MQNVENILEDAEPQELPSFGYGHILPTPPTTTSDNSTELVDSALTTSDANKSSANVSSANNLEKESSRGEKVSFKRKINDIGFIIYC